MTPLIVSLLTIAALTTASYLHGRNAVSKGILIAATCLLLTGAAVLAGAGWWSIGIGSIAACLWWFTFRTGAQAKAELDYMYGIGKLAKIWQAYFFPVILSVVLTLGGAFFQPYLLWWIPAQAASVLLVLMAAKHFWFKRIIKNNRARVEIANGLCGGINISGVLLALCSILGGVL